MNQCGRFLHECSSTPEVGALEGEDVVAVEDVAIVILKNDLNSDLHNCGLSFLLSLPT